VAPTPFVAEGHGPKEQLRHAKAGRTEQLVTHETTLERSAKEVLYVLAADGLGVLAGSEAEPAAEVACQVTLVDETRCRGHDGEWFAAFDEPPGEPHSFRHLEGVRSYAEGGFEQPDKTELAGVRGHGELVQRHVAHVWEWRYSHAVRTAWSSRAWRFWERRAAGDRAARSWKKETVKL
jgi:hypothetical protein